MGSVSAKARLALLSKPERPEVLDYLWDWFCALNLSRGAGMHGLERLTYPGIESWARLMRCDIQPHEVDALMQIDVAYLYPGEMQED